MPAILALMISTMLLACALSGLAATGLVYSPSRLIASAIPPSVILMQGTSGSGTIGINQTSANVTVVGGEEYNTSDIAFISYRSSSGSNLLNSPKERTWNGTDWSSEVEMPTSGSGLRHVRVACSPAGGSSQEKIVVTMSEDQSIDVYVWNGTTWLASNNIAQVSSEKYRCFDVEYEASSGEALLAYGKSGGKDVVGYRTWNGTMWSGEETLELSTIDSVVYWLDLARKEDGSSNEIAMVTLDKEKDVHGTIWNGSAFSNNLLLEQEAQAESTECVAVSYERESGKAMFVWAEKDKYSFWRQWNGTAWGPTAYPLNLNLVTTVDVWLTLKSDPSSNALMLTDVDDASDLNMAYWNGSSWAVIANIDEELDTKATRCADFAWEPTGGKGLLAYGADSNLLTYRTWNGTAFGTPQTISANGNLHHWVQLRTNTGGTGPGILGVVLNDQFDLGGVSWNGSVLINLGETAFTSDTVIFTYEFFDLQFRAYSSAQSNFDHVLKVVNQAPVPWSIRLRAYSESSIARLENLTIYFHDGSLSSQVYISSGSYVQQFGSWYDLPSSSTDYIALTVSTSGLGTSVVYCYLDILVPGSGTHISYEVRFEVG